VVAIQTAWCRVSAAISVDAQIPEPVPNAEVASAKLKQLFLLPIGKQEEQISRAPVVAVELSGFELNIWLHRGAPIVARHQRACREKSQAQWALGDWLLEMQGSIYNADPEAYPHSVHVPSPCSGFMFVDCLALAANHYGYSVGTFQEFRRIARVFPRESRVPGVS
jgi:hypothetical protein